MCVETQLSVNHVLFIVFNFGGLYAQILKWWTITPFCIVEFCVVIVVNQSLIISLSLVRGI